jgi:hypothetical protein
MVNIILNHLYRLSLSKWLIILGFLGLATSQWTGINNLVAWLMVIIGFIIYFRFHR